MSLNYDNCLRPNFTERIFGKILEDKSLNPFGSEGIGKRRLLDDLQGLAQQAGILTVRIDIKPYRLSYASFLKDCESQMESLSPGNTALLMPGKMDDPVDELPSISSFVENKGINEGKRLLILLGNFDVLIGTSMHDFPVEFFSDLNFLKGSPNVTLCCTSVKSHKNSQLFFQGGRSQRTSFLDLEPIDIPPLGMAEIRGVLDKRLRNCKAWAGEHYRERVATRIQKVERPLVFIGLVVDSYNFDGPAGYEERLKECQRQYKKRYEAKHHSWLNMGNWEWLKAEIKDLLGIGKAAKDAIK